jgi:predicted nucleotidyltransferase
MAQINSSVKEKINLFLQKLSENGIRTDKAYIFGSHSKANENSLSDIDFAVISSDLTGDRFSERIRLMKISANVDSKIEPVPFNSDTFIPEEPLVWEILKTGILVEQEEYVQV